MTIGKVSVLIIGVNVTLVDLLRQPLQIKFVYNLVVPVEMYFYECFENNSLCAITCVYNMTKCGIKGMTNTLVWSFPHGIYFGSPSKYINCFVSVWNCRLLKTMR